MEMRSGRTMRVNNYLDFLHPENLGFLRRDVVLLFGEELFERAAGVLPAEDLEGFDHLLLGRAGVLVVFREPSEVVPHLGNLGGTAGERLGDPLRELED